MNNIQEFLLRISKATSSDECHKLQQALTRLYKSGIFSANQLARLDQALVDRMIFLEAECEKK